MYDFDLTELFQKLKDGGYTTVLLQLPEGLKTRATELADQFSQNNFTPIIHIDPCYGACDRLETDIADAIIQFGHTEIKIETKTPTFFIPVKIDSDPLPAVKKALPLLNGKTAIVTTAQHLHTLPTVLDFLKQNKVDAEIPQATSRTTDGQTLGCSFPKGDYDTYLFIGTGKFHPIGLAVSTKKPVIIADPVGGTASDASGLLKTFLSKRAAAIEKAKAAKTFGILVSTKKGQNRIELARELAPKLPGKAYILTGNELTPQKLLGLKIDCLVNTACPRLIEDSFHVPIISPTEAEIVLGTRNWDDYTFDEIK